MSLISDLLISGRKQLVWMAAISLSVVACNETGKIDRRAVVERHRIVTDSVYHRSPAQVGNGNFAFGVDVTGLQTFVPFNTMSHWSWHSFPLPDGVKVEDYTGVPMDTYGKMIPYEVGDPNKPEITAWLVANPHRFNLGRIGLQMTHADGSPVVESDLVNPHQEVDLWKGIIYSSFQIDGEKVEVTTACDPDQDALGVSIKSPLVAQGRIGVFFDFPYADHGDFRDTVGDYNAYDKHRSEVISNGSQSAEILRTMDSTTYYTALKWATPASFGQDTPSDSPHRFLLMPTEGEELMFTCAFSPDAIAVDQLPSASQIDEASAKAWEAYWMSGAAIDLSESTDPRWEELERRIVLSQYVLRVNEAGDLPPQESGLVNNGWFGRFHYEMIWWHGVHYGLWNRWELFDRSLHIFPDFLPTSIQRAQKMGRRGAKWPKCTADFDREWPCWAHGLLIWQQPHPIYFAEMDYRLHPTQGTLDKWKDVVLNSAQYMADYAHYDAANDRYVLGPPVVIVSENTDALKTVNPIFELGYWRYGLRTAQQWRERLGMPREPQWDTVLNKLSPLPLQDSVYVTYEGIPDMWTKYTFEHPALTGVFGMLPGDGVDTTVYRRTLDKVNREWQSDRIWGWDFPMMAMGAARSGNPELAIDMLMHNSKQFRFDEHGLASGGPWPYFPSNGGLLTAVAMMAGGWDGSQGEAPGFPKNGKWVVKYENFVPMQ